MHIMQRQFGPPVGSACLARWLPLVCPPTIGANRHPNQRNLQRKLVDFHFQTSVMKNSLTKLRRRELAPVLLAFLATMFLMIAFLAPATFAAEHAPYRRVAVIELKGMIGPSLHAYFESRLAKAERQGCDLVVVEIESPGGYLHDSLKIARLLQQTEWARTVAWIPKEAYSGAALIAFGCDEIVMGPDSQIGDIGIIAFDPHLNAYRYTEAKWESALVSRGSTDCRDQGPSTRPDRIDDRQGGCGLFPSDGRKSNR